MLAEQTDSAEQASDNKFAFVLETSPHGFRFPGQNTQGVALDCQLKFNVIFNVVRRDEKGMILSLS